MYGTKRLGEWLIQHGKITQEQLEQALQRQQQTGRRIGETLIELGWITEADLWQAQADQYEVPYEPLDLVEWDANLRQLVPASIASSYFVFPVSKQGETLRLAMADPNNVEALDQVRQLTQLNLEPCFTPPEKILQAITHFYGSESGVLDTEIETEEWEEEEDLAVVRRSIAQPPIIRIVNEVLFEAVEERATDIHFEPQERQLEIRYRIDGVLYRKRTVPKALQAPVLSRVKLLAEMDIADRRRPQDGRFTVRMGEVKIDVRASSLPTVNGERIVLRLLNRQGSLPHSLRELGLSQQVSVILRSLVEQPWGLILVTGPTGSGKTTTLYAVLQHLRSDRRNILTCEDPVEYALEGIGQSQVNERAGLTFAAQLRSILRQDPDVILVGEIRDQETAEIACRAAMTGHLVLATLHTNDSISAIPRLLDMGIPPFLINSALLGVVAQRLVRKLCTECREPYLAEPTGIFAFLGDAPVNLYRSVGCKHCKNIGYRGRIGIYEIFAVNEQLHPLVTQRASSEALRQVVAQGTYVPMVADAREKVLQGVTTVEEVLSHLPTLAIGRQQAA